MQEENAANEAILSLDYDQGDPEYPSSSDDLNETFWEETKDENGKVSFVNVDTGEIRYDLPGVTPLKVVEENSLDGGSIVSVTSFINAISEKVTKKTIHRSVKRITRKEERKKFQFTRLKQEQLKNSLITDKLLSAYPNSAPPVGHPDYEDFMKRKVC